MFHFISRWMFAAISCLFAGTIFVSGEWVAGQGNNGLFDILWLLLTLCGLCVSVVNRNSSTTTPRFFHSSADILWAVLMMVSLFSAGYHLATFSGNPRYGMNATSAWVGCGVTWLLFRWTIRSSYHLFVLAAILISVSTTLAVFATYRHYVDIPRLVAAYEKDPERMLSQLNIDKDSTERISFENRLRTQRPVGTYSLTNTLAGLLAPTIVLASGLFLTLRVNMRVKYRMIWIFCTFAMLFCLFLTQSRSGVIAVFVGWTYLAAVYVMRNFLQKNNTPPQTTSQTTSQNTAKRKRGHSVIVGVLVLLTAVVITGTVMTRTVGRNLPTWIEPAKKSLGFRLEYWQASLHMIQDSPLFGCGPGNFQSRYVQYKLPQSSEEIADPHNFLVELAAVFGIPTAVIFLLFVASLLLQPIQTGHFDGVPSPFPAAMKTHNSSTITAEQMVTTRAVVVASTFGLLLGFVVSQPFDIAISWGGLLFGMVLFPPTLWLLLRSLFVEHGNHQPHAVYGIFAATLVSFLTNLFAAGGILYPNLLVLFWFCCAALYRYRIPSPPAQVPSARSMAVSIESLKNRTLPSNNPTLQPPL